MSCSALEVNLQSRTRGTFHQKIVAILFAVIIVGGLSFALSLYRADRYSLVYYGDAVSHLIGGRKLLDLNEDPSCCRIGTVWLPLPHILLMFPSMIDGLFFTGFAGLLVSLPSLALTSFFLYRIVTLVLAKIPIVDRSVIPYAALAGALLYASNPNTLYLGITAMTEAPFMLFFVASGYYFLRWYEERAKAREIDKGLGFLLVSSLLLAAATLSRYEAWILPLLLIPLTISSTGLSSRRGRKNASGIPTSNGQASGNPAGKTAPPAIYVVLTSFLSLSGIVFWLTYNAINYGDPLEFENAENYSAAAQAMSRPFRADLFLHPVNVLNVYSVTSIMYYGPVLLVVAAVGYIRIVRSRIASGKREYIYIFLALPPIFTIMSLLAGIGEMGRETSSWFNSRFVTLLAPLIILPATLFIAMQPKKIANNHFLLIGVIGSLFLFQTAAPGLLEVVTITEAKAGFQYRQAPFSVLTGEKLASLFDDSGTIMVATGSAQEQRMELASGIPLNHFDSMIDITMSKKSFYEPWKYNDKWIVMAKDPDSDGVKVVNYWKDHRSEIDQRYVLLYENQYYEILGIRQPADFPKIETIQLQVLRLESSGFFEDEVTQ